MVDDAKIVVEEDVGDFLHLPEVGEGQHLQTAGGDGWNLPCFNPELPQSVDKLV